MPSGAGHDAQDMAHVAPMGMIFVPSQGGISHAPKEYTAPVDLANGADVLLRTLLAIDRGALGGRSARGPGKRLIAGDDPVVDSLVAGRSRISTIRACPRTMQRAFGMGT